MRPSQSTRVGSRPNPLTFFERARSYVHCNPVLRQEVRWQRSTSLTTLTESEFLSESAWVVLCSGFRESIVKKRFSYISLCFSDWESARSIVNTSDNAIESASMAINHKAKLAAIVEIARMVDSEGFDLFKKRICTDPVRELQTLPYIGPITAQHLAKNIGAPIAKTDRHLWSLCKIFGFPDADDLCAELGRQFDEPVAVVDLILWRYVADNGLGDLTR